MYELLFFSFPHFPLGKNRRRKEGGQNYRWNIETVFYCISLIIIESVYPKVSTILWYKIWIWRLYYVWIKIVTIYTTSLFSLSLIHSLSIASFSLSRYHFFYLSLSLFLFFSLLISLSLFLSNKIFWDIYNV